VEMSELSKTQLSEIKMVFKSFDKDGDGSVDSNELKAALQRLGLNTTDKNIQSMIKEVDINKNGKLEFDEFVQVNYNIIK
jgi:Ca2+-binding EF-hand superfamily protein